MRQSSADNLQRQSGLTRLVWLLSALLLLSTSSGIASLSQAQNKSNRSDSHSSRIREASSPEARELVERAMAVICIERQRDPQGSVPIDEMQARPSLPVGSKEAVAGAERAQRLLPAARTLASSSLRQLAAQYYFRGSRTAGSLDAATARIAAVKRVRPDMESRDNASVLLHRPNTITFGTIFLAGLPSDEGMISVLAHELVHIADGDRDSLRWLFDAIGARATEVTGSRIRDQKAEELTCDLVGVMASRRYVDSLPNYEPLPRRLARAVEHNCVADDEGDEDHLSPRTTIRAVLALNPTLVHELVYGREEKPVSRPAR